MQCLPCLCVQCRDPMNLVDIHNGVSVPDKNSKPVTLHSECFRTWLNEQCAEAWSKDFNIPLPGRETNALAAN
jgi:hypothetical protein